jgi:hypothetical protein
MTVNAALVAVIAASICAAALTAPRGQRRTAAREVLAGGLALALLSLLAIAACAAVALIAALAATAG